MCYCGDPYCRSCGPAQGNFKCAICGKWTMDGGCDNPKECAKQEDAQWKKEEIDYCEKCGSLDVEHGILQHDPRCEEYNLDEGRFEDR